jgi:hypothetical protein
MNAFSDKLNVFQMSMNAQKELTYVEEEQTAQTFQVHISASVLMDTKGTERLKNAQELISQLILFRAVKSNKNCAFLWRQVELYLN